MRKNLFEMAFRFPLICAITIEGTTLQWRFLVGARLKCTFFGEKRRRTAKRALNGPFSRKYANLNKVKVRVIDQFPFKMALRRRTKKEVFEKLNNFRMKNKKIKQN